MKCYSDLQFLNVGTGKDITIGEFAQLIAEVVGFNGKIEFDRSRPDGAPQKLLDVAPINDLGWRAQIPLREGLRCMYADFVAHYLELSQAQSANSPSPVAPGRQA